MEDKQLFKSIYFAAYSLKKGEEAASRMEIATDCLGKNTRSLESLSFAGHNLAAALGEGNMDFFKDKRLTNFSFNGANLAAIDFNGVIGDKIFMLGVERGNDIIAKARGWPELEAQKASANKGLGVALDNEDLKSMLDAGRLNEQELYELYIDMKNTATYLKEHVSVAALPSPDNRTATLEGMCNLDFFSKAKQRYNNKRGIPDQQRVA